MSKGKIICIAGIAILVIAAVILLIIHQNNSVNKELKNKLSNLSAEFTCTAHTGCMDTEENSIEAIEAGVKNGAQIVEFDLNFNENNEPILSHDAPTGNEVTLEEAFKKVSEYDNLKVNVDLKSCAALEKIKAVAEEYNILDRIFFTGVNDEFLESVKKANLGIPYYLNVNVDSKKKHNAEYIDSLVQKVKDSGAIGINFNKDNASAELVEAFHKNSLMVSIWTVDKEKDMKRILCYSPDNITTRNPMLLNELISACK
ncbi:MAG: glycerophosphodiester phosphodiesterase [Eubacterium sp.]|nr:glycerophosphodiester phosphodiesterase [Eubacterium sp.]